jgi:hypothetical protein
MKGETAIKRFKEAGFKVEEGSNHLIIEHKGVRVVFWLKKQWFSGKGVRDGRGVDSLIKQLKEFKDEVFVSHDYNHPEMYNSIIGMFQSEIGFKINTESQRRIKEHLKKRFNIKLK